jgi:chromosome segregation ATPase
LEASDELVADLAKEQANTATLRRALEDARKNAAVASREARDASAKNESLSAELAAIKASDHNLQAATERADIRIKELEAKLEAVQGKLVADEENRIKLEIKIETLEAEINEIISARDRAMHASERHKSEIGALRNSLMVSDREKSEAMETINTLKQNAELSLAKCTTEIETLRKIIQEKTAEAAGAVKAADSLRMELELNEDNVQYVEEQRDFYQADLRAAEAALADAQAALAKEQAARLAADNRAAIAEAQCLQKEESATLSLQSLKEKLDQALEEKETALCKIESLSKALSEATSGAAEAEEASNELINELEGELARTQSENVSQKETISLLETKIEKLTVDLKEAVEKANKTVSESKLPVAAIPPSVLAQRMARMGGMALPIMSRPLVATAPVRANTSIATTTSKTETSSEMTNSNQIISE